MENHSDIFIIGGGINGVAIAADAAGRGLSVTLCEKNDLASGTSSESSKLIHGGLRYLEFYEFGLVRKALLEREILLKRTPNLVLPLEFIMPYEKHLRPSWQIRIGLFIYDHLAKRNLLPGSKTVDFQHDIRGQGLLNHLKKGFSYYDCFTDDARLVVLNAISAKEHGATILTHTTFLQANREKNHWKILTENNVTQEKTYHYAKALINVGGPWIKKIHDHIHDTDIELEITLDKGSHIVVPKIYEGSFAYILQNDDKRIVFAIPYHDKFTLIGTTDVPYHDDLDHITIATDEENYLCNIINNYFKKSISKNDIIWSYAGVRCLQKQAGHTTVTASRDFKYLIEEKNQTILFTIIGGKLTTHRTLAEDALNQLRGFFPQMKAAWTAKQPLPGGDIPNQDVDAFYQTILKQFPWLPADIALRYTKQYGTRVLLLLKQTNALADLGLAFGHGLYQKEIEYLIQHEWARSAEDILWRRTKLGLYFSQSEKDDLSEWLINNLAQ